MLITKISTGISSWHLKSLDLFLPKYKSATADKTIISSIMKLEISVSAVLNDSWYKHYLYFF